MSLRWLRDWLGVRKEFLPPAPAPLTPASRLPSWFGKMKLSDTAVGEMAGDETPNAHVNPFVLPDVAPGVMARGHKGRSANDKLTPKLAMDDAVGPALAWATNINQTFSEGIQFMGYPYLSELTQRAEYRRPAEILAKNMTRKWLTFLAKSEDEDKSDRIKELTDEFNRLDVKGVMRRAIELDGFFGRAQIFIDTGVELDDNELGMPLALTPAKIAKDSLKALRVIEPIWTYPQRYDTTNPISDHFYRPETWMVMGAEVHSSRLLTVVSRPVPDLLKAAYAFGGIALSQMAKPYVDNWLRTRQSVSDLIWSFTVWILKTDMSVVLTGGATSMLKKRLMLFNKTKNARGVAAIDKEGEEIENVSAPLSGLDALQAQTQEHMSAVTGIPLSILLGITPSGLNATTEGETRAFYDWIEAEQEAVLDSHVRYIMNAAMLNIWGEIDEDIDYRWNPLWTMTEKERAELKKAKADERAAYVEMGAIDPAEVRGVIANEEDSEFSGIDVDKMPEPPESDPGEDDEMKAALKTGAEDAGEFNESDHPRNDAGQFGGGTPKRTRIRDDMAGTHSRYEYPDGTVARIQRMNSAETMGLGGWHDLDAKESKHSWLDDTEPDALREWERRKAKS